MLQTINPQMLVLARESRGLSQSELATAIAVTQGKISKYENGLLDVSDNDLSAIARTLDYDAGFFYQTDRIYGLGSSFLFHRRRKTAPVRIQKRVQAQVNVLRIQVERLLRGAEVRCERGFERIDIDECGGDPEDVARRVRSAWQLPTGPVADLTAAVESAGGLVLKCDFGTDKIDGTHLWVAGLPPLFVMNAKMPGDRYRFSLAHEVGHAIIHALPYGDIENEANRFAAELLMPRAQITGQLVGLSLQRAARLKLQWKVAMQAIILRARDLRKISDRKYRRLLTELSASGHRRVEPFRIEAEEPRIVKRLVATHRYHHGYTVDDLRRLLFTTDPQFFPVEDVPMAPTLRVLRLHEARRQRDSDQPARPTNVGNDHGGGR